jgi:hypothetical protein
VAWASLPILLGCSAGSHPQNNDWGTAVNGIRCRLSVANPPESDIQKVRLRFEIQNIGVDEVMIIHASPGANWVLNGWSKGKPLPLTDLGLSVRSSFSPGGTRFKSFPVRLHQGEIDRLWPELRLSELFLLPERGVVQFQMIYEEQPITGWAGRIESNVLTLKDD